MKRILGIILTICMLLGILPTNVFAANITIFNVTVQEPKVGEELSYKASVPETASTYVTNVEWNGKLDALGKVMPGNYEVRVTVRIKDGMDDKYIKKPSKDTVKVNGNSAELREITADKKQAVVVYKFTVSGEREEVKGQEIVNTESNILEAAQSMSSSVTAAVMSASLATAGADDPFADMEELRDVINFTIEEPIAGRVHSGKVTTSHPDIDISSVTWAGQVDDNGAYIVGNTYTVVVEFKIKRNVNKKFVADIIKYKKTLVNGEEIYFNNSQVSDRAAYIMKTFEVMPPKAVVDIKSVFTQAQADERWYAANDKYPSEIIVKEGESLDWITSTYSGEQLSCIKKIVLDYEYSNSTNKEYDSHFNNFPNLEELWLGPDVDPKAYLTDYEGVRWGLTGDEIAMPYETGNFDTQLLTVFVSDSKTKGFTTVDNDKGEGYHAFVADLFKRFKTRLYSGDVMEAYAKGPSAGYEWCTNHNYTAGIYTPDRVYKMATCQEPIRYYYSCSECGKCEYNPNHTTYVNPNLTFNLNNRPSDHYITERDLSDRYFLGINSRGERVYWKSCAMCGNIHNDVLGPSEGTAEEQFALELSSLKEDYPVAFAVRNERYVTAKMSTWAQNDVQWASQNGILDLNILGSDYTAPITRLQFASVAVKLAECLIGSAITPAPQGTFADTDNEYALKAFASGITSGVSATEFNPNGTLTRQQMATFIYRALMYVRDNTNIRYTTYTPALEKYADSWAVQDWAKTSLGFMNALGLVKGISDTEISPDGTCTIEQAVVVANRSVNADQIGWYQVPLTTEERFLGFASDYFESRYYYAPTDHAPTQSLYIHSDRIWVDIPTSGGQKKSENPDMIASMKSRMIATSDPYTGQRAWVPEVNFTPIKELKDMDVADFNQYYSN